MIEWINGFLSAYTGRFFIMQVLVIACIFVLGVAVTTLLLPKMDSSHAMIFTMAFPVGLSMFIFVSFIMLIAGVPYKASLIFLFLLVIGLCSLCCAAAHHSFAAAGISVKRFVLSILLVIVGALIVCSGYFEMSVSNDSLYYFWQYPRAITDYEGLRDQFDNFLTDTGIGAAIIGTLPFLFGFGETFGIQSFFNFNFILFFSNAVFETLGGIRKELSIKKRICVAVLSGLIIGMCTPVYILAHWAMANMYFMEMCFIILYLVFRYSGNYSYGKMTLVGTLLFALSLLRIEGGIFSLLIIAITTLLDYRSKDITAFLIMPSAILVGIYDIKIFTEYTLDNQVKFLTPGKALIQFAAFLLMAVYVIVFRRRVNSKFAEKTSLLFAGGLIFVNIVLLLINSGRYIANLKAFAGNLFGQSGWGILPYVSIGAAMIILIWELFISNAGSKRLMELIDVKKGNSGFWLISSFGFVLISLAVSWARGDNLDVATGDSGNRVLLQAAPILVMMFIVWMLELVFREDGDSDALPDGDSDALPDAKQ